MKPAAVGQTLARNAAIALSSEGDADSQSIRIKLLADIREIFAASAQAEISSSDLAAELQAMPDRPWGQWNRGKPITPKRIADFLGDFSIRPGKLKTGNRPNGYERSQFGEAFDRYLRQQSPPAPAGPAFNPPMLDKPLQNNELPPIQSSTSEEVRPALMFE